MNKAISNRYNIFNLIHKGIRAMFHTTAMAIQHTDLTKRNETMAVFAKINEALVILKDHTLHQKKFILPLVAKHNLLSAKEMESEHLAAKTAESHLVDTMAGFNDSLSEAELQHLSDSLLKAFNYLNAFYSQYLTREEEILNSILWQYYSDEEISCIYKALTASLPPEKIMLHGRWVMRGINNKEIIDWLMSYYGSCPEAFQCLLQLAEEELAPERWNNIQEVLCEGEMLPFGCDNNP